MSALDLSVYLVTDAAQCARAGRTVAETVAEAVSGGVTAVQVREKTLPARHFLDTVRAVAAAVPPHVAVLVNDRVDVFLAARAEGVRVTGVHVGQADRPADGVRELIGPDAVLGLSAATPEQLTSAAASAAGISYVGIGAINGTTTKRDAPPALGHEEFARLVTHSPLPAVGIGGITSADLPQIRRSGAVGAAVVSAICASATPRSAAAELAAAWGGVA